MNYYKLIKEYLAKNPVDNMIVRQMASLEEACTQYYYVYSIYKKLSQNTLNTLKDYVDEELFLTGKKQEKSNSQQEPFTLEDKLYVEFFTEIYNNYQEHYTWNTVINNPNIINDIIDDFIKTYFDNNTNSCLKDYISSAVIKYYTNTNNKIDLHKVHKAFEELENALNTPKPTIEESVLAVISKDTLNDLFNCLKNDSSCQYANFYMRIAPIRKALCDGTYHKYTIAKGNTQIFFNLNCHYNLEQLSNYLFSDIDEDNAQGLSGLLHDYKKIKEDLNYKIHCN